MGAILTLWTREFHQFLICLTVPLGIKGGVAGSVAKSNALMAATGDIVSWRCYDKGLDRNGGLH